MKNIIASLSDDPNIWILFNLGSIILISIQILYLLWKTKKKGNEVTWKHWTLLIIWCSCIILYELIIDNHFEPYVINWLQNSEFSKQLVHELGMANLLPNL